jgi:deoxyribonuclease-2
MLSCINEIGAPVQYWSAFKLPESYNYIYYDPVSGPNFSHWSLNNSGVLGGGAIFNTMNQIWNPDTIYALYNDEIPGSDSYNFSVGHAKGVWMWSNSSEGGAVFLQHSVPKFPEGPATVGQYTGFPSNAHEYGQHAFCISLNFSELEQIVAAYQTVVPQIYETNYNNSPAFPELVQILDGESNTLPGCYIQSLANVTMFVKNTEWNNELYAECIGPKLDANLYVESWLHGEDDGPYCPPSYPTKTLDIQSLHFKTFNAGWQTINDHSKWCVASSSNTVCFSDINRVLSQYERGGGAICIRDYMLWDFLYSAVSDANECANF